MYGNLDTLLVSVALTFSGQSLAAEEQAHTKIGGASLALGLVATVKTIKDLEKSIKIHAI